MVVVIITFLLFVLYAGVILYYTISWKQIPEFTALPTKTSLTFSIIIPARNEEHNIGGLLQSILRQNYPKDLYEVIVVDDHSHDKTADIVKKYEGVILISLHSDAINSYKKKAIETGIASAKNEWIVCTDADCWVPENWLQNIAALATSKEAVFIAAPVKLVPDYLHKKEKKAVHLFQALDFLVLQGITAASVYKNIHSMCNGANLAYKKDAFYKVQGFKGIDTIASGDDMLLMYKIWKQYPGQVLYLKSKKAIVETLAAKNWKDFLNQRIRWASKATNYDDKRIFIVLVLVYLFNFSFLILLSASFFDMKYLLALAIFWIAKTLVELPFITGVSRFFSKERLIIYFFFFQPAHIAYTIIAGLLGSIGNYEWKGRIVK